MSKYLFLLLAVALSGCQGSDGEDVQGQQERDVQLDKMQHERDVQLDEMQQELRLVVKEVVSLNAKLDALNSKQKAPNQAGNAAELDITINLPAQNKRLGSSDAKYAMVEFMDYQCPYCIRYAKQTLPTLKQRYIDNGQLQYFIRDYPLEFHSKAEGAAIAANCAAKQSKYWPMHDQLVQNAKKLGNDLYLEIAQNIDLDIDAFTQCQLDPKMKEFVAADFEYGSKVGTRGTPNFYIGKIEGDTIVDVVQISGARSAQAFDKAIQQVMSGGS